MADPGMSGFSALHMMPTPLSDRFGLNTSRLFVISGFSW
jgi:hypothetical protein